MKRLILISLLTTTKLIYAIPTISIPNMVYRDVEVTPITYSDTTSTTESGVATTQKNKITTQISKQIEKDLPMFNADVRGAIINSGQFKVLNLPQGNNVWTGNTKTVINFLTKYKQLHKKELLSNTNNQPESAAKPTSSNPVANAKENKPKLLPDYILLGQISAISQNEDVSPIKDTDKTTTQYNINLTVDYQLINTKDNSVMASFTAYGHGSDVKILTNNNYQQVLNHNIPKLIKDASTDLADDILKQLNEQFGISQKTYDTEPKVITDVKVYD